MNFRHQPNRGATVETGRAKGGLMASLSAAPIHGMRNAGLSAGTVTAHR